MAGSPIQRKVSSQQKANATPASAANSASGVSSRKKNEPAESSSFLFIVIIGFILLIAYTVWSSIQTYSNNMINDME